MTFFSVDAMDWNTGAMETTETPYRTGRIQLHDERSKAFRAVSVPPGEIRSVRWTRYAGIFDQNVPDLGCCTGTAAVGALNTRGLLIRRRRFTMDDAISVYSEATTLDPWPGSYPPEDTGSSVLSALKVLHRRGLIAGYRWAFGLDHTLAALMLGPIVIGVPWYVSMFRPVNSRGLLKVVPDNYGMGHAVELVGYDDDRDEIVFAQSWGRWGDRGFGRLRRSDLGDLLDAGGEAGVPTPLSIGS